MVLSCGKGIMMQFFNQRCKYRNKWNKKCKNWGKKCKKKSAALGLSPLALRLNSTQMTRMKQMTTDFFWITKFLKGFSKFHEEFVSPLRGLWLRIRCLTVSCASLHTVFWEFHSCGVKNGLRTTDYSLANCNKLNKLEVTIHSSLLTIH